MATAFADDLEEDPEIQSELSAPASVDFRNCRVPGYAVALLEALRFNNADCGGLEKLDHSEWQKLLALCDASQLTLLLRQLCRPSLPDWVRTRVDNDYEKNAQRFQRLKAAVFEIANSLSDRSIPFALLKGFAHSPDFTPDPLVRAQGDIDIWCLPNDVRNAQNALLELGYKPYGLSKGRHLDPMIRETEWQWRGDYFAVDLPIPIDLHYQLWDEEMECIPGPPETELWGRCLFAERTANRFRCSRYRMFRFRGTAFHDAPAARRCSPSSRLGDRPFPSEPCRGRRAVVGWRDLYTADVRIPQVISFALANQWFGCRLPALISDEISALPDDVLLWMRHYGASPIEGLS